MYDDRNFKHSIISLHLCQKYLTAVKFKTLFTQDKVLNILYIHHCASMKSNTSEKCEMVIMCKR